MRNHSFDEFIEPPAHFYPGYFWVINDRIDVDAMIEQLREMRRHKAKSVCFLPQPHEFRPLTFNTRFDMEYLGERYFKMVRKILDEAEKLGMNWWLYDEGGWPSGSACGQVVARDPLNFAKKQIAFHEFPFGADMEYKVPEDVLCVAALLDGEWRPYLPGERISSLGTDTKLRVFYIQNTTDEDSSKGGAPQQDPLSRKATETFIDITHERYKKYVGRHFSKTIRFTFIDEPSVAHPSPTTLPWTNGFAETFLERKGYDIVKLIPAIIADSDEAPDDVVRGRVDFFDVWSTLFVENQLEPIKEWCRENNLLSSGHMGGDDETDGSVKYGFGHILRALRGLDLPGVDVIWRQLFPGGREHHFTKYASSVSRQSGVELVMTENFGVYGNGLTPEQMKWITDQQYLQGANLMVICCYPYSTEDHLMVGERPHAGPVNPLWKYSDLFHEYTARLGYMLTRGKSVCSTAFYFDVRGLWAGGKDRLNSVTLHDAISELLLNSQCDFDFVDDDALKTARIAEGELTIGAMRYDTVILPATKWLEDKAACELREFASSGGILLKIGEVNGLEGLGRQIELSELPSLVKPLVTFEEPCDAVRIAARDCGELKIYFAANRSGKPLDLSCRFEEKGRPALCSLEEGRYESIPFERDGDATVLKLTLPPYQSEMLLFGVDDEEITESTRIREPRGTLELSGIWTLKPLRKYEVGERNYKISDIDDAVQPVSLGDWNVVLGENFSGDAVYSIDFEIEPDHLDAKLATLDLGVVSYACEVRLNGESAGRKAWSPYSFNVSGKLKSGLNHLDVIVTNTLANALLDPEVEKQWHSKTETAWPSTGHPYEKRQRSFERDSVAGGLSGPVVLKFGD